MSETTRAKGGLRTKIGIYLVALTMMGAIGINSCLASINAHFADESQTMITNIMAFVTIGAIIATILCALISDRMSKKWLACVGVILFLIGGLVPIFLTSLKGILACRIILGVGVGINQGMCAALISENFEGKERASAMGQLFMSQMIGCILMTAFSSVLVNLSWNYAFLVHLIGILSLIGIFLIPNHKPEKKTIEEKEAERLARRESGQKLINPELVGWWLMMMLFFIPGQVFSNNISFLMEELGMGNSVVAGFSLIGMCIGGVLMGPLFGICDRKLKNVSPAVGFMLRALGYLMIGWCGGIVGVAIVGSIVCGMGVTYCLSTLNDKASNAVAPAFLGFALSIVALLQNIGQTISAYICNPLGFALADATGLTPNQGTYAVALIWFAVMGVIFAIWGGINNKKKAGQYYRVNPEA